MAGDGCWADRGGGGAGRVGTEREASLTYGTECHICGSPPAHVEGAACRPVLRLSCSHSVHVPVLSCVSWFCLSCTPFSVGNSVSVVLFYFLHASLSYFEFHKGLFC